MKSARLSLSFAVIAGSLFSLSSCKTDEQSKLEEIVGSTSMGDTKGRRSRGIVTGIMEITEKSNASFFNDFPSGQRPDRNLGAGTLVRQLKDKGTYSKIELASGRIGYIRSRSLRIVRANQIPHDHSFAPKEETASGSSPAGSAPADKEEMLDDGATKVTTAMDPSTYPSEPDTSEPDDDGPAADAVERNDPLSESIKRLYEIHSTKE